MNNFWQRTITGALFVLVLLGAVLFNTYTFIGLCFLICVLGLREYAFLFKIRENKPDPIGAVLGGTGIALIWVVQLLHISIAFFETYRWILILGFLLVPIVFEILNPDKRSYKNLVLSYAGLLYINLGVACFANMGFDAGSGIYHSQIILGFLVILWSSDTFAYITGRAFGKTPLAPKISPKKTWEGSIGGAVCTLGVAYILSITLGRLSLIDWFVFALIIIVFGTIGDLIESRFKRILGVKDSGNILPGHGGILDRFDSLLFAAPFVLIFLRLISM